MAKEGLGVTPGGGVSFEVESLASGREVPYYLMAEAALIPVAASLANARLVISSTVVDLGDVTPAGATHALIRVEGADIRWWDDGKVPTGTHGQLLDANAAEAMWVRAPADFKMIRDGAESTDATVTVSYYRTV